MAQALSPAPGEAGGIASGRCPPVRLPVGARNVLHGLALWWALLPPSARILPLSCSARLPGLEPGFYVTNSLGKGRPHS